jgi:hypothetical protein
MTKVDYTYMVSGTPDQAQARFLRDVAPELRRTGDFGLDMEKPGHLLFSNRPEDPFAFAGGDGLDYSLLSCVFPQRIRVDFDLAETGTRIAIHGRAARIACKALESLRDTTEATEA